MVLRPCLHCTQRGYCEIEIEKRAALKAAKVTSASFRCPIYREMFKAGDVVEVSVQHYAPTYYDESRTVHNRLRAIVTNPPFDTKRDGMVTVYFPPDWIKQAREAGAELPADMEAHGYHRRYWPRHRSGNEVTKTGETTDINQYRCIDCREPIGDGFECKPGACKHGNLSISEEAWCSPF